MTQYDWLQNEFFIDCGLCYYGQANNPSWSLSMDANDMGGQHGNNLKPLTRNLVYENSNLRPFWAEILNQLVHFSTVVQTDSKTWAIKSMEGGHSR